MECNRYFNRSCYWHGFNKRVHKFGLYEYGTGSNTHTADR